MIDKDYVVGREPHLCGSIFVFYDRGAVGFDAFNPLLCALALEEASASVLGPGLDGFNLDVLKYFMDGYVLEGFLSPVASTT